MRMVWRPPAAQWSISCIKANPWDEVAVNARAPATEAPMQEAMAECSDSTLMNLASSVPSEHISERSSTTWVCGVMG